MPGDKVNLFLTFAEAVTDTCPVFAIFYDVTSYKDVITASL